MGEENGGSDDSSNDGEEPDDSTNEIQRRIEELDFDGDTEAIRVLRKEARKTIDHQISSLGDIDSKAISILRVNIVLVGLVLTAVSIATDSQDLDLSQFYNLYFGLGFVALLGSTALASLTYTASDSEVGVEDESIHGVIEADLTERQLELAVAQSQAYWIDFNNRTNLINAPLITLTTLLIVVAIVNLSLGVYAVIIGDYMTTVAGISWLLLLLFILKSGIIEQLRDLREEIPLREWRPW